MQTRDGIENISPELKHVYNVLYSWTLELCAEAGYGEDWANNFFGRLKANNAILAEYAYYHDNGTLLCKYKIGDYTPADVMIWQIDHFRAHMDRMDNVNKTNGSKLLLETFSVLLDMDEKPELLKEKSQETGTDLSEGWTIG